MDERTAPRTDRVYLDPSVERCEPALHCTMRLHCARYLAAVPAHGGSIFDGTADALWTPSMCGHYVPASQCLKPAPAAPRPRRRHWDAGDV